MSCKDCDKIKKEIEELKAENKKLKERIKVTLDYTENYFKPIKSLWDDMREDL